MKRPELSQIDHLVLTVKNIPETVEFYTKALGMKVQDFVVADGTRRTALLFGAQKINLHQQGQEFEPKAKTVMPGSADLCFLSQTDLQDWVTHFSQIGTEVLQGPIARTGATGPIRSVYVRDPDGNLIEVSNQM